MYVKSARYERLPPGIYRVIVGKGGRGGESGQVSSLGNLLRAEGGKSNIDVAERGGAGWSGGGAASFGKCTCNNGRGGSNGSNGGDCSTNMGGKGQGNFHEHF